MQDPPFKSVTTFNSERGGGGAKLSGDDYVV